MTSSDPASVGGVRATGGVVGAVLCGGASRRMGRDKALIEVDGIALARRVADALRGGGCGRVVAIGGDGPALAALGLEPVPDGWPGEGPLGGLATALGTARGAEALVVAPCDLLSPSATVVDALLTTLVEGGAEADAATGEVDGRVEWVLSAWRPRPDLAAAVAALVGEGRRRLDSVAAVADRVTCLAVSATDLRDADVPSDLDPADRGRTPGAGTDGVHR